MFAAFCSGSALATSKVGEFAASGFIFKDSVEAVSVEDPDGISCDSALHVTTYHLFLLAAASGCTPKPDLDTFTYTCFIVVDSQRSHHIHFRLPQISVRQAKQRFL